MKPQRSLWHIFILILLGALFFFTTSYQYTQRADEAFKWVTHTHEVIEKINSIHVTITDIESDVNGYVISKNKDFIKDIESRKTKLKTHTNELERLTIDNPVQQKNCQILQRLVDDKLNFQNNIIRTCNTSFEQALQLIAALKEKNISDSIKSRLVIMQLEEQRLLGLRIGARDTITQKRFAFSVMAGCVAFILLIFALFGIDKENKLRKIAEQNASAKEAKYKGLIENASIVAFTTDLTGHFTYISNKCKDITGYGSSELLGLRFTYLVDETQQDFVTDFYAKQLENNISETVLEFPIRSKDGIQKWVEQSVVLLQENGVPISFQSIVKDISEKKYAEKLIHEAEGKMKAEQEKYQFRLQAILDNIPMIVYIKDLEGRYEMVNKRFKEAFKMTDEMVLGKLTSEVTKDEKALANYIASDEKVKETLKEVEIESVIRTTAGERNVLITKFPLFDESNQLFGICGIDKDITEMVRNRQQLINARLRAEKAEKLQEEFLANMSHEIRTPMNGIIGMTNMLMDSPLNTEQNDYVQLIKHSSDTLLVLINDILDLSKIKAGRMSVEYIDFSIKDIVDQIVSPMQLKTKQKGVVLSKLIDGNIPACVKGDQHKLAQILNNLVSNAVKFTESGTIIIEAGVLEKKGDSITMGFSVSDTGIGISSTHLESIFESFVQAGDDMVRRFGGTGLGLAITKKLLELQGGKIQVSSTVGKGTCFKFEITFLMSEKQAGSASPVLENLYANKHSLAGKRILLVEDNLINQKVVLHILKKAEMQIEIAGNGKEAIAKLEGGNKYNFIIMDLQMPEMDGFQTTTYIRKKLNISTPIIAMTASALRNEKIKCFESGMNEYLTKPFVPADLFKQLHRFLEQDSFNEEEEINTGEIVNNDLYNLCYLEEMEDDEYLIDVLRLFLETTPALLEEMHENVLYERWDEVYKNAHKLKSSLGIMQMNTILSQVANIEMLAKEESKLEKISSLVKRVIKDYNLIRPMIEADLNKIIQVSV